MSTIALFHFDESEGVAPADETGNLQDLAVEPGIVAPPVVEAWSGQGRAFSQAIGHGYVSLDVSSNGTLLVRDATIEALIVLSLDGATGPMTLIARGINDGSTPENYAYGLEFEEQAGNPGYVEMRLFWQDVTGAIKTAPPGVFKHAGNAAELYIAATRRWEAADRVVCRYYVAGRMIAELVSVDGDISGGVSGSLSIGARKESGTWDRFLNGTIDELLVSDLEKSPQEIAETWARITVHQPAGQAMFRGLAPRGVWWFDNPANEIGRRTKVVGQALGLPIAQAEDLRNNFLPDACPAHRVTRWEKFCGLVPRPDDSLDVRRARVMAHLAADEGFSIPALQAAFRFVFDLDADAIEILEFTNDRRDPFDTLRAERWSQGTIGTWAIASGTVELEVSSGTPAPLAPSPNPCHIWTPLDRGGGLAYVEGKIVDYVALPSGAFVGMFFHHRIGSRTFWFGVYNDGVSIDLGYREIDLSIGSLGSFTSLATIAAGPIWLRMDVDSAATINLQWSITGPSAGFTVETISGHPDYDLAGFGAFTTSTPGADITAHFDDFRAWCPLSVAAFVWFAYRDPSLPGSADLIGANALARKVAPAHTYAAACSSKSLVCGDPIAGQVGRVPMGVL